MKSSSKAEVYEEQCATLSFEESWLRSKCGFSAPPFRTQVGHRVATSAGSLLCVFSPHKQDASHQNTGCFS